MAYIQDNLLKNETIQHEGKTSVWSLLPKIIIGIVLLPFWGIGLLFLLSALMTYLTTELAVTNKRIIAKFGFIRRSTVELNLDKVESVQVDQGILGRIFNYGSIVVSGAGNPKAPIPGISQPVKFRSEVFELQETLKESEKAS